MKKFIKETVPELKKDLFKDGVKYIITAIFGVLGIWAVKRLGLLNNFLTIKVNLSYYSIGIILFIAILVSSFGTFFFQNRKYQKLKQDSLRDELTNLFNYKAFPIKLREAISVAKKENKLLSLILIDIDNFKKINDTYLLKGGDNVMKQIGAYLGEDSRASDITCRQHIKGDEFIIIAHRTSGGQARMAAERKRKEIEEKEFQVDMSNLIKITVSCGIAEFVTESDTFETLVEKANKALLTAKSMGKNKSIVYQE